MTTTLDARTKARLTRAVKRIIAKETPKVSVPVIDRTDPLRGLTVETFLSAYEQLGLRPCRMRWGEGEWACALKALRRARGVKRTRDLRLGPEWQSEFMVGFDTAPYFVPMLGRLYHPARVLGRAVYQSLARRYGGF